MYAWSNKPERIGECKMTLAGFIDSIQCVALSPDGHTLITGSSMGVLRQFETCSGKELRVIAAHASAVTDVSYVNQQAIASASADETLSLWDALTGRRLSTIKEHGFVFIFQMHSSSSTRCSCP